MGKIKNYLIGEIEAGRREYNSSTREYERVKPEPVKMYTVNLEGMDIGLRFFKKEDAMERANSFGIDACVGYVMEMRK